MKKKSFYMGALTKTTAVLMVLSILLGLVPGVFAAGVDPTFDIAWETDSQSINTISGRNLVSDTNAASSHWQYPRWVQYNLSYSTGGETLPAGAVEIRLPGSLFTDRDGHQITVEDDMPPTYSDPMVNIPLAQAPAHTDGVSFNYTIDPSTKEIVITNYEEITGASTFNSSFLYYYVPRTIEDEYTKSFTATLKETRDGNTSTFTTNPLSLQVLTSSKLSPTFTGKQVVEKYETWQSEWGACPSSPNPNGTFFVKYLVDAQIDGSSTQPFVLKLVESPQNGGQVVSYATVNCGTPKRTGITLVGGYERVDNTADFNATFTSDEIRPFETQLFEDQQVLTYAQLYVIVQYPRGATTYRNNYEAQLIQVDDHEVKRYSVSCDYTYVATETNYGGDAFGLYKTNGEGGMHADTSLTLIRDRHEPVTNEYNLKADLKTYTLSDGGTKTYAAEIIDDLEFLSSVQLVPGDYEITDWAQTQWDAYKIINGTWGYPNDYTTEEVTGADRGVIKYYVKTGSSSTWTLYMTARTAADGTVNYTLESGGGATTTQPKPPANTTGVKMTVESKLPLVELNHAIKVTYKPTAHVLGIIGNYNVVKFTNVGTLLMKNDQGTWVNNVSAGSITGTLAGAIRQDDTSKYGNYAQHGIAEWEIRPIVAEAIPFLAQYNTREPDNERDKVKIHAEYIEGIQSVGYYTPAQAYNAGFLGDHDEGTYHVLLPFGVVPDLSTIQVQYHNGYDSDTGEITTVDQANVTRAEITDVTVHDNWRGSGRTMLEVDYKAKPNTHIVRVSDDPVVGWLSAQSTLLVTGYRDWDTFAAYGLESKPMMAVRVPGCSPSSTEWSADYSLDNAYLSGYPAELLNDLNDDHNPSGTPKDYLYNAATYVHAAVAAVQSGFSKKVKSESGESYETEATVNPNEEYSYRLTYNVAAGTKLKNLIIYDFLENNYGSNPNHWRGTYQSVDVSRALLAGINATVYYTTATGVHNPSTNPADTNLTGSGTIWSTTPPSNMASVTGIAIDLRTKTGGGQQVYDEGTAELITIHMKAPATEQVGFAYNNAHHSSTTVNIATSAETPAIAPCNTTTVSFAVPTQNVVFAKHDENGDPLGGAKFTLYPCTNTTPGHTHGEDCTYDEQSADALTATSSSGLGGVLFSDLPQGSHWILVETTAPAGYEKPDGYILVEVLNAANASGRWFTLTASTDFETVEEVTEGYIVNNTPKTTRIIFNKYVKEEGGNVPVPGATFELYKCTNTESGHNHTTGCTHGTTAVKTAQSEGAAAFVEFTDIKVGTDWILVEKPLEGYQEPEGYIHVNISTSGRVTMNARDGFPALEGSAQYNNYKVFNEKLPTYDARFTKVDFANAQTKLSGAVFNLYQCDVETAGHTHGSGTCHWDDEHPDFTATSGTDGIVLFEDLPAGSEWIVVEKTAPGGYRRIVGQMFMTISDDGTSMELEDYSGYNTSSTLQMLTGNSTDGYTVKNRKGPQIEFYKYNEDAVGLSGAEFTLYPCTNTTPGHTHGEDCTYDEESTEALTATSSTNGLVSFEEAVAPDSGWVLIETGVPAGYETPEGFMVVTVADTGGYVITSHVNGVNTTLPKVGLFQVVTNMTAFAATVRVKKVITNYDADYMSDQVFFVALKGVGCDANGQLTLSHNQTSKDMTVAVAGTSGTIDVSEAVPMAYKKNYTVTVINANGSTATVSGRKVTVHPGDDVTIVVNNVYDDGGYFKNWDWKENLLTKPSIN